MPNLVGAPRSLFGHWHVANGDSDRSYYATQQRLRHPISQGSLVQELQIESRDLLTEDDGIVIQATYPTPNRDVGGTDLTSREDRHHN